MYNNQHSSLKLIPMTKFPYIRGAKSPILKLIQNPPPKTHLEEPQYRDILFVDRRLGRLHGVYVGRCWSCLLIEPHNNVVPCPASRELYRLARPEEL